MAKVKYLLQGLRADCNHEDTIKELLSPSQNYDQIIIYSAFNRSESVYFLNDELTWYGKKACVIIGIRNGSTSKQGLEALFKTGVDLYAVDTGYSTVLFHPKAYVGINHLKKYARAIIGSANFTPGGFRRNIENSCVIEFDLSDKSDQQFINEFIAGKQAFLTNYDPDNVIHIQNEDDIKKLFNDGRVVNELARKRLANVGISTTKKIIPHMPIHMKKHLQEANKAKGHLLSHTGSAILNETTLVNFHEVWKSRPLSERDLTIPQKSNTNPTGSMLLKKGMYNIDFQSYFRYEVFKNLKWSQDPSSKKTYFEYASAKFHFIIDGIEYPQYVLTIQYDKRTDTKSYKQRNGNTHLHWGAAKSLIKNRALLGKTLYLYQIDGKQDEFIIEIKNSDVE